MIEYNYDNKLTIRCRLVYCDENTTYETSMWEFFIACGDEMSHIDEYLIYECDSHIKHFTEKHFEHYNISLPSPFYLHLLETSKINLYINKDKLMSYTPQKLSDLEH